MMKRLQGVRTFPQYLLSVLVALQFIRFLAAALVLIMAGCASAPSYRTPADLPRRVSTIRAVGLLPPMIALYEEQYRFGLNKPIPKDDWSRQAAESVRKAFIEETSGMRLPFTLIDEDNTEVSELLNLYSAVDISIRQHAYETTQKETFREKVRCFDYSLGPAKALMERHHVDAVWIISGINLIPTTGAQVGEAAHGLIATLSAFGGGPGIAFSLKKLEFRAALVDKAGDILFYDIIAKPGAYSSVTVPAQRSAPHDLSPAADEVAEKVITNDLREQATARHYIRQLLSAYQKAVLP